MNSILLHFHLLRLLVPFGRPRPFFSEGLGLPAFLSLLPDAAASLVLAPLPPPSFGVGGKEVDCTTVSPLALRGDPLPGPSTETLGDVGFGNEICAYRKSSWEGGGGAILRKGTQKRACSCGAYYIR